MKKIVTVVGARPQFIKASAVSSAIHGHPGIQEILIHTGQHYDEGMSDIFFKELGIPTPNYQLGVGSGLHGQQTGRMLEALEPILAKESPDWLLIYGDTNSTLAGALAAAKLNLPIAHVEAGMRSFRRDIPEEINRVVADHLSSLLLPPTRQAVANLANEGIAGPHVILVGDVMFDVARKYAELSKSKSGMLSSMGVEPNGFVLATIHRAENTDDLLRLGTVFRAMMALAQELPVVVPLHPRTQEALARAGIATEDTPGLQVIPPVGYLEMALLESSARVVMTDSGGVQKEAYFHRRPCVTFRTATEWPELIEMGWNRLVDPAEGSDSLVQAVLRASSQALPAWEPIYGTGNAAQAIVKALLEK